MKKPKTLLVLALIILSLGCSEGAIFSDLPEGFNDKQFTTLNSNLQQIGIIQEKILSELNEGSNFVDINFSLSETSTNDRRGQASYSVSILDGFVTTEWSSNIVETYTFELRVFIDDEWVTLNELGIAVIATPNGLDYDYGARIPYLFGCFEYPDEPPFSASIRCTLVNQDYLFNQSWESEGFETGVSSRSFRFSNSSLNLFTYDLDREVYVSLGGDITIGSGEIVKLF